jgi:hypothetical protein
MQYQRLRRQQHHWPLLMLSLALLHRRLACPNNLLHLSLRQHLPMPHLSRRRQGMMDHLDQRHHRQQ